MEVKIKQGEEMIDATIEMVDGVMVVSPKEVKFEPKDGDVVYVRGSYEFVFIYKDNLIAEAYYYAALNVKEGKIILPDGGHIGYVSQLRPATEEEKQKLFDKLAEEGYSWDAERKVLIKLKWKPKDDELYCRPRFNDEGFVCCTDRWDNVKYEFSFYDKGWIFKTEQECQEFCNRLNDAINQVKP